MLSSCALLNTLVGGLSLYTTLWTHCRPWPTSQLHQGNEMSMRMKARSRASTLLGWMKGVQYKVNCNKRWKKANGFEPSLWGKGGMWLVGRKGWGKECTNLSKMVCVCRIFPRGGTRAVSTRKRGPENWELLIGDRMWLGVGSSWGFCDPMWHEGMSIGVNLAVGVGHLGADQTPTGSTGEAKGS